MNMPHGGMGGGFGFGGGGGGGRWQMRELAKNERFDWPIIRRALRSFLPYWPRAALISVLLLAGSAGNVVPAWMTQRIIDEGILKGRASLVIGLTLLLIATALVTGLLGVWQAWLSNAIAQQVMSDYRLNLFRHVQRQSIQFFSSRQSGDLVSRVMNDVTAIQNVITSTLVGLASNLLLIVMTLSFMFAMNGQLTILALIVVPGFVLPTQRVGRARQRLQGEIQRRLSTLTIQLSEVFGVSGAMLTRIFNREQAETERFSQVNQELRDLQIRQSVVGRWLFMWLGMFSSIGPALLWGYGGWLAIHHRIGIGVIVSFTALLGRLYNPLSQLAQLHVNVYASIALFRRIFALLDVVPEVQGGPEALPVHGWKGGIRLERVSYAYPASTVPPSAPAMSGPASSAQASSVPASYAPRPSAQEPPDSASPAASPTAPAVSAGTGGLAAAAFPAGTTSAAIHHEAPLPAAARGEPVLRGVHLTIEPGQTIALVGPSGAGKTTLMNLIPRFADPTEGRVLLDDTDIKRYTLDSLRSQMGMVPQDPYFFHDSVRNNLLFAKADATEEALTQACHAAQIHDLIASLPDGYDTVVGERGYRLSGGERQRLAIARVLLREPKLVLLDEATSALDSLVERQIQQALETLLQGRTAIVIAHRLSTILKADRIVVLENGRIAAEGAHEALLTESPLYRRLYEAQFAADHQ